MIGTLFIAILGGGREQYIVNQDKIPSLQGFWNDFTNLLINLSVFVVLTIVIVLIGVLRRQTSVASDKVLNNIFVALCIFLSIFVVFQVTFPEYSNF